MSVYGGKCLQQTVVGSEPLSMKLCQQHLLGFHDKYFEGLGVLKEWFVQYYVYPWRYFVY